jgi:aminocarboxymuconate-semialdehyde decarboxylase
MSFTVDVHQHILADAFWRATNDAHSPVGGILPAPWSKESTLSYMDEAGIDVAITSISTPGVHVGDDSAARDLARRVNELSAELMQEPPNVSADSRRYLCPTSTAHCARWNTAWTFSDWTVSLLFSNVRGMYLGDVRFRPLFDELERRGAVAPNAVPRPRRPQPRTAGFVDRFHCRHDAGDSATSLWQYFRAHPKREIYIFSHAGGTIPYLATRFSIIDKMNVIAGAEERGTAADTLRRRYWDTALSWRPPVLRMHRSVVGMGQVLRLRLSVSSPGSGRRLPP